MKLFWTLALLGIAAEASAQTTPRVFPAAEWQHVDAKEAGFREAKLDVLRAWLKTQKTTGLLLVSDGRVVLEHGDVARVSKVASVRKSILAMLYGRYVESGQIDLERTVADVGLEGSEGLLVPVDGKLQRVQHALGRIVVRHDPLRNDDRLRGHAHRLRVERKIDDQLFGGAGDAAKIGVRRDGSAIVDFNALRHLPLLLRAGLSLLFPGRGKRIGCRIGHFRMLLC